MKKLAIEVDRFGLSNRTAASSMNAAFIDCGFATESDITIKVDHKKVERARKNVRELAISKRLTPLSCSIFSIYFDGKIDRTLVEENKTIRVPFSARRSSTISRATRLIKKEDHYVVVGQPGNIYLNNFTPSSAKAIDITSEILKVIVKYKIILKVVGADGTTTNVGNKCDHVSV